MKIGSLPNYVVQVYRTADGEESGDADLYEGMYTVALNVMLHLSFVPLVGQDPPPWPPGQDPPPVEDVTSPAQIRWAELLYGNYSVTPSVAKAGRTEQFDLSDPPSTVFYVTPAEFDVFSDDLGELADLTAGRDTWLQRDDILDRSVIRYIDTHVLESPMLRPVSAGVVDRQPNRTA